MTRRRRPTLTVDHLIAKRACGEQVALFRATFPEGAPLTLRSLSKARRAGLNVAWCAWLLPDPLREQYLAACAPLREQYLAACAPLREQYRAAGVLLWEQYLAAIAPPRQQDETARAQLHRRYLAARALLWEQYRAARTRVLLGYLVQWLGVTP